MPEIRKIVVGPDYKNGMHFAVGQEVVRGTNEVARIRPVENGHEIDILTLDGKKELKMWKRFIGVPTFVEYNINY